MGGDGERWQMLRRGNATVGPFQGREVAEPRGRVASLAACPAALEADR